MNFSEILWILTGIPGKPFTVLQNSGIPQDFESVGFGFLQTIVLQYYCIVLRGNPEISRYPIQCRPWWVCEYFLEWPISTKDSDSSTIKL